MTERDVFESRLHAALLRHVAAGPTDFDALGFARTVAAKEPRRHGFASARSWRGLAIPRLAWLLLLAGLLLVALVGGTLLVGSQQRRLPAVVPPVGQVFECPPGSTPDEQGPVDQTRPLGLAWYEIGFDRRAGRLVAFAGDDSRIETWTFDVCTNTWTRMHPNQEPPPGTGQLVYDVDSDVTIASDGIRMWAYDLEANTWTEKGPFAPFVQSHLASLQFYDPVSGHVVAWAKDGDDDTLGLELWGYDVEADTWTPIPQATPPDLGPHYQVFAYDASVDRLVAYARSCPGCEGVADPPPPTWARTWLFDLRTGTWSGAGAVTPPDFNAGLWGADPAIAYDEAAQRVVLLGQGHAAAYDATADRWEALYEGSTADDCGTRPDCRLGPFMVYDPVNERLVVSGGFLWTADGEVDFDDVLAFDARTGEWTVLLEASPAQPAPNP
jgi:hypothetical protein